VIAARRDFAVKGRIWLRQHAARQAGRGITKRRRDDLAAVVPIEPAPDPGSLDSISCQTYAAEIDRLIASLRTGGDPAALEVSRRLIDQVIVYPYHNGPGTGIELIGNLVHRPGAARLSPRGGSAQTERFFALFISSVKEGPGAEPLAFLKDHNALSLLRP
jgi:hypothetical protein